MSLNARRFHVPTSRLRSSCLAGMAVSSAARSWRNVAASGSGSRSVTAGVTPPSGIAAKQGERDGEAHDRRGQRGRRRGRRRRRRGGRSPRPSSRPGDDGRAPRLRTSPHRSRGRGRRSGGRPGPRRGSSRPRSIPPHLPSARIVRTIVVRLPCRYSWSRRKSSGSRSAPVKKVSSRSPITAQAYTPFL